MKTTAHVKLNKFEGTAEVSLEVVWSPEAPWSLVADAMQDAVTKAIQQTLAQFHEAGADR